MKAGIITFHRALNYGALLQAYALKTAIESIGHDADILDYRNAKLEAPYVLQPFLKQKGVKNKLKYVLKARREKEKRRRFDGFRAKQLGIAPGEGYTKQTISQVNGQYDRFFTGSDQVWNPAAHDFDQNYYLDFVNNKEKKYSYAASFGVSKLENDYEAQVGKLLDEFTCCSVREEQGAKIVNELSKTPVRVDLDPVFLLTKENWAKNFQFAQPTEKYALMYHFELTDTQIKMARCCYEAGYKIKFIGKPIRSVLDFPCEYIPAAGPKEFAELFYGASFVITNSFHGTAFAINFGVPMAVEYLQKTSKVNSRLENILQITGLTDRRICQDTDLGKGLEQEIDWRSVNARVQKIRESSLAYLKGCFD